MSTVTTVPEAGPRKAPRRMRVDLALIGIGLVVAAGAGGMALFGGHGGSTKTPTVNKYATTTTAVTNWWAGLPATQRTSDCTAFKSDPTGTVTTIQSAITASSPAAAAVFDPTALSAYFTAQCPK